MPKLDPNFKYKFKKGDPIIVKVKLLSTPNSIIADQFTPRKGGKFVFYRDNGYVMIISGTDEQLKRIEGKEVYIIPTNWSKEELMETIQLEVGGDPNSNLSGYRLSKIQDGDWSGADEYARITSIHEPETFTFSAVESSKKEKVLAALDKVIDALEAKKNFDENNLDDQSKLELIIQEMIPLRAAGKEDTDHFKQLERKAKRLMKKLGIGQDDTRTNVSWKIPSEMVDYFKSHYSNNLNA